MSCRWIFWEYERMVWIPCLYQCLRIAKFSCLFFRRQCSWCSWVEHSRVTGQAHWDWRGAVLPLIDAFHGKNIKWITSAHEQFAAQLFQTMIVFSSCQASREYLHNSWHGFEHPCGKCRCKGAVAIQLQPTPSPRASLVLWRPESNRVKSSQTAKSNLYISVPKSLFGE